MATRIGRRKSSLESPRRRGNPASKSKTGARGRRERGRTEKIDERRRIEGLAGVAHGVGDCLRLGKRKAD